MVVRQTWCELHQAITKEPLITYGRSAGVWRVQRLGVVRSEWQRPSQARQRRGCARQAPPKGAFRRSRSLRCTIFTGRQTAIVRIDSDIGSKPE